MRIDSFLTSRAQETWPGALVVRIGDRFDLRLPPGAREGRVVLAEHPPTPLERLFREAVRSLQGLESATHAKRAEADPEGASREYLRLQREAASLRLVARQARQLVEALRRHQQGLGPLPDGIDLVEALRASGWRVRR